MESVSPLGQPSVCVRPDASRPVPAAASLRRATRRRLLVLLISLPLLHLSNPLAWGEVGPGLWYPPAGLGLALIAWCGPRAALWLALDGLLVVLQALLIARWTGWHHPALALAGLDAVLGAALLRFAWWLYHREKDAGRRLDDPRSAKRFLFLVPGFALGLWALLHTLLLGLVAGDAAAMSWSELSAFWLSRALGVLPLTPLLLVALTPWLARRGLVRPEIEIGTPRGPLDVVGESERWSWGDGLELFGLAAGAAVLTRLAVQSSLHQMVSWHLWGTPLLLIVWAGLRQGLRGGAVVAGVSSGLALLSLSGVALTGFSALLIQSNLMGQCAVALLVASSSGWVRRSEDRYRQVMAHLPVVIYSARFRRPDQPPLPIGALDAEIALVSAASEPIFGCRPQELLGEHEHWLQRVHPDDREVLRAAVLQIGRQVQPVTCEYRLSPPSEEIRNPNLEIRRKPENQNTKSKKTSEFDTSSSRFPSDFGFRDSDFPRSGRWVRDTLAPRLDAQGRLIGWEGLLTDITEQRALADDLRRTTSMLHALVGNLPAGVFFVQGPTGHPILVNARARALLGQREDMAAGLEHLARVYRLHRPDGTPYPVEELPVFLALRKGLTSMREDIVVHRPDGRRTPLVTWAAPVSLLPGACSGPPAAAVWVLEDLTALHQAEAARRDTEVRLRAILETMAEGVVVLDHGGGIVDCNAAAATLLGHPAEQLRGLNRSEHDWGLLREDGTPLPAEEYPAASVLRLGRPVRNLILGIYRHDRRDADSQLPKPEEVRWVLVNAMPLAAWGVGENRAAAGVVVTLVDMTATLRAQQMLRDSEEKYRGLVESLPLMVIQADPEMRVTYVNPALRDIAGYDLDDIADPRAWATVVHVDDLPVIMDLAYESLTGRNGRVEFRYRAKDGSEKVGLAFGAPRRRADGAIIGSTTLVLDVTRERRLEQELLRAQRLELVGRLAGGIAHDFNNLLSVILSLTELVDSSLPADHASHPDLGRIREATEQAASLANQLLTFSKQRQVAAQRIEVNHIAARTLELLRASLPSCIDLRVSLAEEELFIRADETQVQQVLMNLCLNARDAMPSGGVLRVQTALGGDEVRLIVQDNGIGMTEEVKEHLFDPFFSTKDRGTGLGLAVVRRIVEGRGGRVEATSEIGRGARFDVWWPFAHAEEK